MPDPEAYMAPRFYRKRRGNIRYKGILFIFFLIFFLSLISAGKLVEVNEFIRTSMNVVISIVAVISLSVIFISPVSSQSRIPPKSILKDREIIIAGIIFVILMIVMIITRNDVAIGGNERREWEYTGTIIRWFKMLFSGKFSSKALVEISKIFWPYNDFYHPPFTRYIFAFGHLLFHKFISPFESYRLGSGLFFALTASSLYLFVSRRYGLWAGLFSAFSLFLMPRLFTHAHFIGTDVPIAALWALTAFSYYYATTLPKKVIFSIILGFALLTKVQAFFIPIPLLLWSYYMHKTGKDSKNPISWSLFFSVSIITPVVVLVGWPWLWHNDIERFLSYLHWVVTVGKDTATYFGNVYGGNFGKTPWHYPFILLFITIPLATILMSLIGIGRIYKGRLKDERGVFLFLNMIVPLLIISLVGGWEGTREFLAAFIFLAGIAGIGFVGLSEFVIKKIQLFNLRLKQRYIRIIFFVLIIMPTFVSFIRVYPYGLFYYNKFIGGLKGAYEAGSDGYWDNQLGEDLINFMNTNLEKNARVVYNQGTNMSMKWYQEMGRIKEDIVLTRADKVSEDFLNSNANYCIVNELNKQFTINDIPTAFSLSYDGINLVNVLKKETIYNTVFTDKPLIQNILNHNIGENIKLIGYNIDSRTSYPGSIIRITYFWSAQDNDQELTAYFKLEGSPLEVNNTPSLGGFLPLKYWPRDKIFEERFDIQIPEDFSEARYRAFLMCNLDSQDNNKRIEKNIDLGQIVILGRSIQERRR